MDYDPAKITAYLNLCNEALREQSKAAKGWPNPLILPEPENKDERKALDLFTDELSNGTGLKVTVHFQHRHRETNAPGTRRDTTEGQSAACCLAYGEPIGQKTRSITQAQNGPIDPPTPDPFKTL
jgi:hypothetical protein